MKARFMPDGSISLRVKEDVPRSAANPDGQRVRDVPVKDKTKLVKLIDNGGMRFKSGKSVVTPADDAGEVMPLSQRFNLEKADLRFKRAQFASGKPYVQIDTDQSLFDNAKTADFPKIARKVILSRFRGKVVGELPPKNAYVRTATAGEFAYPAKPLEEPERSAKMRSAGELDNLLAVGEYAGHEKDDGRHPEATGGWDYYNTIFEVGGKFFRGKVNLLVNNRGRIFHDMTDIKEDTRGLMDQYGKPQAQFPGASTKDSVSQTGAEGKSGSKMMMKRGENERPADDTSVWFGAKASMSAHGFDARTAKEMGINITNKGTVAAARSLVADVRRMNEIITFAMTSDRPLSAEENTALVILAQNLAADLDRINQMMSESANPAAFQAEKELVEAKYNKALEALDKAGTHTGQSMQSLKIGIPDDVRDSEIYILRSIQAERRRQGAAPDDAADAAMAKALHEENQ
ncbi:MAG: hypothetical protein IIT98_05600, partial [Kiritimatiellae bacterium]|nr:hypothetical protein [Kiritimatiellia bacterium]